MYAASSDPCFFHTKPPGPPPEQEAPLQVSTLKKMNGDFKKIDCPLIVMPHAVVYFVTLFIEFNDYNKLNYVMDQNT